MEYYIILKYEDGNVDLWGKCSTCFGIYGTLVYLNSDKLNCWLNKDKMEDINVINGIEKYFNDYSTLEFGDGHAENENFKIYVCKVERWEDLYKN